MTQQRCSDVSVRPSDSACLSVSSAVYQGPLSRYIQDTISESADRLSSSFRVVPDATLVYSGPHANVAQIILGAPSAQISPVTGRFECSVVARPGENGFTGMIDCVRIRSVLPLVDRNTTGNQANSVASSQTGPEIVATHMARSLVGDG
jgi:hypothetical protein